MRRKKIKEIFQNGGDENSRRFFFSFTEHEIFCNELKGVNDILNKYKD